MRPPFFPLTSAAAAAVLSLLAFSPSQAQAQSILSFDLGVGPGVAPEYQGSDSYEAVPVFAFRLNQLQFGSLDIDSPQDRTGFSFGPSFGFEGERDSSDDPVLAGIPDRNASLELGVRLGYDWDRFRVFGALRGGVTGHEGLVAELGADLKADLGPDTFLTIGPRVTFADNAYMSHAFDVPLTATALPAFDADGGLKSYGIDARLRHQFTDAWAIEGRAGWERLTDDAADSPIVRVGDRDQFTAGIVLIRTFNLRF